MKSYFLRHLQVFFYSLGELVRAPFASLMSISVIGITLALPSGLYLMIDNIQRVSTGWDGQPKISLFLKRDADEKAAKGLGERIRRLSSVAAVQYVSPAQALAEFRRLSGFGETLDALGYNPLPPVLIVQPASGFNDPDKLETLVAELGRNADVDLAQLDLEWVKRLYALLQVARRAVWILASLLGLAVVLIIGNTIRLAVLNRRDEIEVIKLVGGTDAFIRRPFLYAGVFQGLLGASLAWLLVSGALAMLAAPIGHLASLYASSFRPRGLDISGVGLLLAAGLLLGWLGSRIAVGRHLQDIEPR
jgi:cell division transport system permease protein